MTEKTFRVESDLLGELKVPADALYGVQTQRGINNYHISRKTMSMYHDFIIAIAYVKLAAVETNHTLGVINDEIAEAISQACREIIDGKWHENFPIDMVQGGAGTSVNMNANEVIANRALEIMGHEKGDYQYCLPNDHCNCGQSTNDVYPTTIRLALIRMNKKLVSALTGLISAFRYKGDEFKDCIKMGRTQQQPGGGNTESGAQRETAARNQYGRDCHRYGLEFRARFCQTLCRQPLETHWRSFCFGRRLGRGYARHWGLRQLFVSLEAAGCQTLKDL